MREKNVVVTRKEGNKVYYSIANPKTLEACILMREAMIEQMEKQHEIMSTINL
jgi:ArsR family transcriptional regulator